MSYGDVSTSRNYDVQCPYCKCKIDLCHDDGAFYDANDREDCECPECEETFQVSTSISYNYTARCADDKHDFEKYIFTWGDDEFTRKRKLAGTTCYALRCKREDCDEGKHFRTKEEYDAYPAFGEDK